MLKRHSRRSVILLIGFGLVGHGFVQAAEIAPSTSLPGGSRALRQANAAFYEAFTDRDLWAMRQLWSNGDYVSAIHPAHPKPFFGWDNVRMSWKNTFAHNRDIRVRSLSGFVHLAGPVGWVIDATRLEAFQTQTGQPVLMDNVLATKIFLRQDEAWQLAHYHAHLPNLTTELSEPYTPFHLIPPVPEAEQVAQADETFYKAWSAADPRAMDEVWSTADYVTAIHPDFPVPFLGPKNVRASWLRLFADNPKFTIHRKSIAIHVSGPVAWVVDASDYEAEWARTGRRMHAENLLTTKIFERDGGAWFLVHFHAHRAPYYHMH